MNIFMTDPNPVKCAEYLDTKRVIKMCLESAQMLCTALQEYGIAAPYKSTHKNHPANVWCRESRENYLWLWHHYDALLFEYHKRCGKFHKSGEFKWFLLENAKVIPSKGLTPPANCAANQALGISYKHVENVYDAYKLYLADRWETDKIEPKWD